MVITNSTIAIGDEQSLDIFDSVSYVGFGDDSTTPSTGDTTLVNEILRVGNIVSTKDLGDDTYTIVARVPITQFNSNTVKELGLFEGSSGSTMGGRIVSPTEITKTSSDEIVFTIRVKVQTTNN